MLRAKQRSGTTACLIPPCPTPCMCSVSNPTGIRPRPIPFLPAERRAPSRICALEFAISLVQLHQRVMRRSLETHQELPRQHFTILLIVGQIHRLGDAYPTIDVAVEDGRLAGLVPHMHVLEPIEIVPAHELHIGLE